jgi:hypothetical protein
MGRAPETPTQALHRLTSHEPGRPWTQPAPDPRVRRDLRVNDMTRFPWPCKRYADGQPRVPLPRSLPSTSAPALGVLDGTAPVNHRYVNRWQPPTSRSGRSVRS